jgi:hypothetical protein
MADDPIGPEEPALPIDNVGQLLTNALQDAGIIGLDEAAEPVILNRAFRQANWLLADWARKRWLVYRIEDYSFISIGAQFYNVGLNQTINISPRPDRLEYAFLRFLTTPQVPQFPVDIPLSIIQSHEDYSRITVKSIGTLPWRIFYDPAWPVGILRPWPVPQASIYEIHCGFKVVLPRFTGVQQSINFPPEYEVALNWCLVRALRMSYQLPPDPGVDSKARNGLNTIRLANAAMSTMQTPAFLRGRNTAYDYRGDNAGS